MEIESADEQPRSISLNINKIYPITEETNQSGLSNYVAGRKYLPALFTPQSGLSSEKIPPSALHTLLQIEMTRWDYIRWKPYDYMASRLLHYCLLRETDVMKLSNVDKDKSKSKRIWIHGFTIPLKNHQAMFKSFPIDTFRKNTEFAYSTSLHLVLYCLLLYQLIQSDQHMDQVFKEAESNSIVALSAQFHHHRLLFGVFLIPLCYGVIQGLRSLVYMRSMTPTQISSIVNECRGYQSSSSLRHALTWGLPSPTVRKLRVMVNYLLWVGDESDEVLATKEGIVSMLMDMAHTSEGMMRIRMIQCLGQISAGTHFKDIQWLKERQYYTDKTLMAYISYKTRAFDCLQHLKVPHHIYSLTTWVWRYELWSIGASPSL